MSGGASWCSYTSRCNTDWAGTGLRCAFGYDDIPGDDGDMVRAVEGTDEVYMTDYKMWVTFQTCCGIAFQVFDTLAPLPP